MGVFELNCCSFENILYCE